MRPHIHVVRPGDCIESIAERLDCDWRELWDHNGELRRLRSNPNLLAPGDVVRIPESYPRDAPRVSAGQTNRFRATPRMTDVHVRIVWDRAGREAEPASHVGYRLHVGTRVIGGTTDGDGVVTARVPVRIGEMTLVLAPDSEDERRIVLRAGHLDPIDAPRGVEQRLRNLGFLHHEVDESDLDDAIARFRGEHGLSSDDAASEWLATLVEVHGG
jgi:N-acetylmuramoyl-L-alanine amidase